MEFPAHLLDMTETNDQNLEQEPQAESTPQPESELPAGIMRLRDEWVKLGLAPTNDKKEQVGLEPIVFPEPVGDYRVSESEVKLLLGLSEEATARLLESGELDSILVKFPEGNRRMISQSALERFLEDSGMAREVGERITVPAEQVANSMEQFREELQELRELQARQLQQFKDVLLLELRNLKEQDRDLTSFVFDLTEALEEIYPKLKKRRRTSRPDSD